MYKKLSEKELASIIAGRFLSNRQCMMLGGLATISLLGGLWGSAVGVTTGAIVGGCFG